MNRDSCLELSSTEVPRHWSALLDRVERGEAMVITREGKRIARLTPFNAPCTPLSNLDHFRKSIKITAKTLSETLILQREEERYHEKKT